MKTHNIIISALLKSIVLFIAFLCSFYVSNCTPTCTTSVSITDPNIDLGKFFIGGSENMLTGDNILEFVLTGDALKRYDFYCSFANVYKGTSGNTEAKITHWTWEIIDYTYGSYGNLKNDMNNETIFSTVRLKVGPSACTNYAKFRLTAKYLDIYSAARPGNIQFTVTVTVTVSNI